MEELASNSSVAQTFVRGRGLLDLGSTTPHNRDTAPPRCFPPAAALVGT